VYVFSRLFLGGLGLGTLVLTTRLLGSPHTKLKPRTKFETTSLSSFEVTLYCMPKILGPRLLLEKISYVPTWYSYTKSCTKFEVSSSSNFGDIDAIMVDMPLNDL